MIFFKRASLTHVYLVRFLLQAFLHYGVLIKA